MTGDILILQLNILKTREMEEIAHK